MRENRVRSILAREGWDSLTIDLQRGLVDYPAARSGAIAAGCSGEARADAP
jgi:hypothetical protein